MKPSPQSISVIAPVSLAWERVKDVLFRPFDLAKWLTIGFCAWLAFLGESGGGGGGGNWKMSNNRGEAQRALADAKRFVMDNLEWIIPLAAMLVCIGIVVWLAITWLSSRGKFMFLHCVATNSGEVREPWIRYGEQANSLFLFRIVFGLISLVAFLPFLIGLGVLVLAFASGESTLAGGALIWLVLLGLAFICGTLVFVLIAALMEHFVVPIMFLQGTNCMQGWRQLIALMLEYKGSFVLYILFQVVMHIILGVAVFALVIVTCCVAGCLLAIPYIGTVLFLPVLVFFRSYSAYYLAQYGEELDVFRAELQQA